MKVDTSQRIKAGSVLDRRSLISMIQLADFMHKKDIAVHISNNFDFTMT